MEQEKSAGGLNSCGKLYIVGTPIGNLSDISIRALDVLRSADCIAAEDTRVTIKLLNRFDIKTPLTAYHEHNKKTAGSQIISRIEAGEKVALVTDAGMPAISDPGEDLVDLCRKKGLAVESVPGPCALITALSVSGMPAGRFCFEGFLSVNKTSRQKHLETLKTEERTMIFYEAPHKLAKTLGDMLAVFGDRPVALVKELTKIHEQVLRTTLLQAVQMYAETEPKGEFVLIVSGKPGGRNVSQSLSDAVSLARSYMAEGKSASMAAREAAEKSGQRKSEIYKAVQNK